jgi:K+ transporter
MEKSGEVMRRWVTMLFISLKKTREQACDFFALPLDRGGASG